MWVASGRDYHDVPPLKGVYSGGTASSLDVTVDIDGPLGLLWRAVLAGGFRDTLQADLDRLVATAERDVAALS